ncbi:MAG: type II toxin-antitoxin system VapC family toxin [Methylococcaceae bacterium]
MKVTINASVIVKWFIPDNENHTDSALALFKKVEEGTLTVVQPLHWQAEVIAVLTRLRPEIVDKSIVLLDALELPVIDNIQVYQQASQLSQVLNHHLFDTLYHAVAIAANGNFMTDDRKYYNKAKGTGNIELLA